MRMIQIALRLQVALLAVVLAGCGGEQFEAERMAAVQQAEAAARAARQQAQAPEVAEEESVVPDPVDLPQFAARKDLMKAMGAASRGLTSSDTGEARAAATLIGEYSLAARHPRFEPQGDEYLNLAINLWVRNRDVQAAMEPGIDPAVLQQALRAQRAACQACHNIYRE